MKKLGIALLLALLPVADALAQLELPKVWSSHAVIQREKNVPVWGRGVPGQSVKVTFAGQKITATVGSDSTWKCVLKPLLASATPRTMTVQSGKQKILLQDMLVGEVWVASGQSNMEYPMKRFSKYLTPQHGTDVQMEEIKHPDVPLMRAMYVERKLNTDTLPSSGWMRIDSNTVKLLSAATYYFSKTLTDSLHIPVGFVSSSWGGSKIETWTPGHREGARYRHMIEPLAPYAIRGFLWYQGEANVLLLGDHNVDKYYDLQKSLVTKWRQAWGDESLKFYFVQLAPYKYSERSRNRVACSWEALPLFWRVQQKLMALPGCGMAQTTGLVDNVSDIHPPYKWEVGRRLALWPLHDVYGFDKVETFGPTVDKAVAHDSKVTVTFTHARGLKTADGKSPDSFEVKSLDGRWYAAQGEVKDGFVELTLPERVKRAVEVRLGWYEAAQPNLQNGAGLPAMPFKVKVE